MKIEVDKIAIIVIAYNRYQSFSRILESIANIKTIHINIPLIISIDYSDDNLEIVKCAEDFYWEYGNKEVLIHQDKLGLKNHIINSGNLSKRFRGVIILEDDLFVSPYFYDYTLSACDFYEDEPNIAGISLYSYERAESANFTFKPVHDNYDAYFMQYPSSWGQCWLNSHWQGFTNWLANNDDENAVNLILPEFISIWPETSWKKFFAAYLLSSQKYFVYPRIGLSTNFGEVGQHHINQINIRQVDLLSKNIDFKFPDFNSSIAKYDIGFELQYEELIRLNSKLLDLPKFEIDFYCKKNHKPNDIIVTTAKSKNIIHSFSGRLFPLINNLIFNISGDELVLTKFKDVEMKSVNVYKTKFISEFKFLTREILRLIVYRFKLKK